MDPSKKDLIVRLNRIEGQIAALKRSLEADADCGDTLYQVKAATNALKRFAEALSRAYAKRCITERKNGTALARDIDDILATAFTLA